MRIAAVIDLAPRKLGSLEQWILAFVAECRRHGHSVHLFCQPPVMPAFETRLSDLGTSWTPFEQLERRPFPAGRALRRSFDLVYLNLVPPRSAAAYAAYCAWPLPLLYFDQSSGDIPTRRKRSLRSRLLAPLVFRRVAALAGCSSYVVQRDREYFRFDPAKCRVIYNGVDTARFVPPDQDRPAPITIAATAYLIPEKGLDVLVEACGRLTDLSWRLVIVGDGPEEARLREQAARLGVSGRTEFLGLRDDVDKVLRSAEIFVHPARWEEAFGLTITEAMASGCATVASRVGGIPEIIEDGTSGLLFERGDSETLATLLRSLLADPARRRRFGKAARARAVERFDLRRSVEGQVGWIEEQWHRLQGRAPRAGP